LLSLAELGFARPASGPVYANFAAQVDEKWAPQELLSCAVFAELVRARSGSSSASARTKSESPLAPCTCRGGAAEASGSWPQVDEMRPEVAALARLWPARAASMTTNYSNPHALILSPNRPLRFRFHNDNNNGNQRQLGF